MLVDTGSLKPASDGSIVVSVRVSVLSMATLAVPPSPSVASVSSAAVSPRRD